MAAFVEDFDAYFDLDVFGEEFIYTPPGAYPFRSDKSVTVVGIFSEYRFKLGKINQDVPSVIFKSTDLTSIARGAMVERVSSDHQYMVHGWEMEGEDITRLLLTVTAAPADASISYPRFPEDMTVFYDLDVFGEQFTYTPPGTFPHRSDKSKTITGIFSEYRIRADRVDQDVPSVSFPAGELTDLARGAMVERGTKRYKVQGWEMEGEAVTRLILELHE